MVSESVEAHLKQIGHKNVVLYGMETHVCIRQTALDLLERDYDVHLVVDVVDSVSQHDRNVALRDFGVSLITFQSLVFELLRTAEHEKFKACLPMLKQNPEMQLDFIQSSKL